MSFVLSKKDKSFYPYNESWNVQNALQISTYLIDMLIKFFCNVDELMFP